MKKLLRKDFNNRKKVLVNEKQIFILKNFRKNSNFKNNVRYMANCSLNQKFKKNTLIQTINRCIFTARRKRLNCHYNVSRLMFLRLARSGFIFGLKKASW